MRVKYENQSDLHFTLLEINNDRVAPDDHMLFSFWYIWYEDSSKHNQI